MSTYTILPKDDSNLGVTVISDDQSQVIVVDSATQQVTVTEDVISVSVTPGLIGSLTVDSVNGKTGLVVLNADDISETSDPAGNKYYTASRDTAQFNIDLALKTTDDLTEGSTNLYYTDAKTRAAISGAGDINYNPNTGIISFDSSSLVTSVNGQDGAVVLSTSNITEGTNKYWTQVRFDNALNASDTDDLDEGNVNLYYTDVRAQTVITANTEQFIKADSTETLTNKSGNISQWQNDSDYVTSVNGVEGPSTVLDTDNIQEDTSPTNKWFTEARARSSVSVNDTGGDGSLSYDNTTGVFTFTGPAPSDVRVLLSANDVSGDGSFTYDNTTGIFSYTGPSAAEVRAHFSEGDGIDINAGVISIETDGVDSTHIDFGTGANQVSTADLPENTNLYYTDSRVRLSLTVNDLGGDGSITYDNTTGVIDYTGPNQTEVRAHITKAFVDALGIQATSVDADSVALGTDTTGDYVQSITGTANKIEVSGSGTEGRPVTLTLPSTVQIAQDLTVGGNLTVNGDLTYLNTTDLQIQDNLFELNAGLTGTPTNDSGMLIQRGNQTNQIFMWDESVDKFTLGATASEDGARGNINVTVGTLVANIEGDLTGDVTGNVVGNVTGDTTGHHYGESTGDVAGDVTGDLIGDVTGDLTGNTSGTHTGPVVGNVTGNVTGDVSGTLNGPSNGTHTGQVNGTTVTASGGFTGTLVGNVTGDVTGNVTGDLTGDVAGKITSTGTGAQKSVFTEVDINGGTIDGTPIGGNVASTGEFTTVSTTGSITANTGFVGNVTGDVTGNVTGNVTGDVTGDLTGDVTGNVSGNAGTVTSLSNQSTTNLAEGNNLYYTTSRANTDFDTRLATKDTDDLAEGSNQYYTDAKVDNRISNTSIDGLSDVDTSTTAPATNQVLEWDGTTWVPGDSGIGDVTQTGTQTLSNKTLTNPVIGEFTGVLGIIDINPAGGTGKVQLTLDTFGTGWPTAGADNPTLTGFNNKETKLIGDQSSLPNLPNFGYGYSTSAQASAYLSNKSLTYFLDYPHSKFVVRSNSTIPGGITNADQAPNYFEVSTASVQNSVKPNVKSNPNIVTPADGTYYVPYPSDQISSQVSTLTLRGGASNASTFHNQSDRWQYNRIKSEAYPGTAGRLDIDADEISFYDNSYAFPSSTGTTGQSLVMGADNNGRPQLVWSNTSGAVTNVNGQIGSVVLDTDNILEDPTNPGNLYFTTARVESALNSTNLDEMQDVVYTSAPQAGEVLLWDSTVYPNGAWRPNVVSGTGTVTSITGGTGLTGGTITSAGTLNVDVGTTANKIIQLDGQAKIPAVDGSQLTNVPASGVQSITPGIGLYNYSGGTGVPITNTGSIGVDVGTFANGYADRICQFDSSGRLPAVDGSQLTNLPASAAQTLSFSSPDLTLSGGGGTVDLSSLTPNSLPWGSITGTPTTIAGYGITDAFDGAWSSITGTPTTIAGYGITDAFDGAYSSLSGLPTLFSGAYADLTGKPTLFDGAYSSLSGLPTTISGYGITDGVTLTGTETLTNKTIPAFTGNEIKYIANSGSGNNFQSLKIVNEYDSTLTPDYSVYNGAFHMQNYTSASQEWINVLQFQTPNKKNMFRLNIDNSDFVDNDGYITDKSVTAGNFVTGKSYKITSAGTTDFTQIGAADNNNNTIFVATGAGTGTGTADAWDTGSHFSTFSMKGADNIGFVKASDGFIVGVKYKIFTVGTTDFTAVGSADNNVGTEFTCDAAGSSGTGVAVDMRPLRGEKNRFSSYTAHQSPNVWATNLDFEANSISFHNNYVFPTTDGSANQVLTTDGAGQLSFKTVSGTGSGTVTSVDSGTGLTGGPITGSGTLNVDVGTTANKIVQLDGSAKLPAVDGSNLTNLPSGAAQTLSFSSPDLTISGSSSTVDLSALSTTSLAWSAITSTPTTIAGYGITDAFDGAYSSLSGKPTLYDDADVDTHLNTSSATTNKVLSWTGSDYAWVAQTGGGGGSTTINNNADNRIITGSNTANTLNGQSDLTYDGDHLLVEGTAGGTDDAVVNIKTDNSNWNTPQITLEDSDSKAVALVGQNDGTNNTDKLVFMLDPEGNHNKTGAYTGDYGFYFNKNYSDLASGGNVSMHNRIFGAESHFTTSVFGDYTSNYAYRPFHLQTEKFKVEISDSSNNLSEAFRVEDGTIRFFEEYKFPTTDGSANQVLTTDGNGNLTFETPGVTQSGAETLSNKTLASPILSGTTTSASGNIVLDPATSKLEVRGSGSTEGQIQLNCSANSHGQTIKAQPHSAGVTNTMLLPTGSNSTLVSEVSASNLTNKTGNISQWTNDSNYLTSVPAQSFSSLTGKPTTIAGYGITDSFADADVDTHLNTSTATTNQVLSWTGTDYDWITNSGGGGSSTLSGLTDVDITSVQNNDLLMYNSTAGEWQNTNLGLSVTPTLTGDSSGFAAQPYTFTVSNHATYDDPAYFVEVYTGSTKVVANSAVTDNGDGTLTFTAPAAGTHEIRIRCQDFGDLQSEIATKALTTTAFEFNYRYFRLLFNSAIGSGTLIREFGMYTSGSQGGTKWPTSAMTSNSAPTPFVASGVGVYGGTTYNYFKAFDNTNNTMFWNLAGTSNTDYLSIDLGSAQAIQSFKIVTAGFSQATCLIQASSTGAWGGEEVDVQEVSLAINSTFNIG